MVSTLAMTDALAKLLIDKGIITDAELKKKLGEESWRILQFLNSFTSDKNEMIFVSEIIWTLAFTPTASASGWTGSSCCTFIHWFGCKKIPINAVMRASR